VSDFQDEPVDIYTDYHEMLADEAIDAVNDFTPLFLHHAIGMDVLRAGKHLLTEKPLALSIRQARDMVELAREKRLAFAVNENVRQRIFTRAAGWAVRKGLIGDPQLAVIGSLGGLWSPDRIVANTAWRHQRKLSGGGGSIDIGVHHFHLIRYVFGPIDWVSAVTRILEPVRVHRDADGKALETVRPDVDDTYLALVGFENDAIGQMLWSWALRGEPLAIEGLPAFYGSKGCIKGETILYDDGRRESLYERFEVDASPETRRGFYPFDTRDPFALLQYDWLQAIEKGWEPETSGEEGLVDLACAFALQESAARGCRVRVRDVMM
jgi:predicted dehydrogenase